MYYATDPWISAFFADPDAFCERVRRFEDALDLPPDRVPMSHLLFFEGPILVGASRIRWRIVPVLLEDGGHIGYEVRRSARGRGVAQRILRRSIELAREAGLRELYLTAAVDNHASLRVIESQGAVFEQETTSPRTGKRMRRYVMPA